MTWESIDLAISLSSLELTDCVRLSVCSTRISFEGFHLSLHNNLVGVFVPDRVVGRVSFLW